MKIIKLCGLGILVSGILSHGLPQQAHALTDYSPGNVSTLLDDSVKSLVRTVAIGADHRAYMPATPLGIVIGLDLGIDVTAIQIPDDFKTAMQLAGVTQTIPSALMLPRLNIHKGLPLGIDLGFSYISYENNKVMGFEGKWAFVQGGMVLPSVALRLSETLATLYFMKTKTFKMDVVASKTLSWFFDPYVGLGIQFASGDLDVPLGGATGLPVAISGHQSFAPLHVYLGFPIKMVFFNLTGEYDYSFAGLSTFGLKASLAF